MSRNFVFQNPLFESNKINLYINKILALDLISCKHGSYELKYHLNKG